MVNTPVGDRNGEPGSEAPMTLELGRGCTFNMRSCSSARRSVSRSRRSERLDGRVIGERCSGGSWAWCESGEDGRSHESRLLDWDRPRALELGTGAGDRDRMDRTGDGAWICMDIARVGRARWTAKLRKMDDGGGDVDLRVIG